MSNNIYDILGKLPKDNPTVDIEESKTLYESVDPRGDILEAVHKLEEKYYKDRIQPQSQQAQQSDTVRYQSDNPLVKGFLQRAYQEFPNSANDNEATLGLISKDKQDDDQRQADAESWMSKAQNKINDQQEKMQDMAQVIIDQEKRFQEFNRQVASANLPIQKQAQAAVDFAKDTTQQPSAVIGKYAEPQQSTAQEPAQPTAEPSAKIYDLPTQGQQPAVKAQPAPKAVPKTKAGKGRSKLSLVKDTGKDFVDIDPEDLTTFVRPEQKVAGSDITEAVQMIYPEGSPALGQFNFEKIKNAYFQKLPKVDLIFGDSAEKLTDADIYAIVAWFYLKSKKNADLQPNLAARNLSTQKDVQRLLRTDMVNHYRSRWGSLKRSLAQKNITTQPLDFNKPKAPAPQQQQPAIVKPVVQPKKGQLDLFNENNTMKTTKPLEESLMERFATFKESAKPDFLDLDKDGDTDEPMKKAAKDAKEHEPASPDSDAVAKRKRLQALKDKQEDERAEKGDYDSKSSTRVVKGRAYGGAAQKDDEEKDLDETQEIRFPKDDWSKNDSMAKPITSKQAMDQHSDYFDKKVKLDPKTGKPIDEGRMKDIYTDMEAIFNKKGYSSRKQLTPADYDALAKPYGISGKELAVALGHKKASEVVESGLQYYTGKKKYGKEGMAALSKAGREGASEEDLGRIKDKYKKEDIEINEKAVSKQQQKFMGMVHAVQKGKMKAPSKLIAKTAKSMSDKAAGDFAATKHKGLPTKVTEGKDAIRSHPIYTTKEAWDHYSQELAEQEAMDQEVMEAPMVDVQQELDEIAKLAGLPPKMEAKSVCPSCKCEKCECNENLDPMVPTDSASPMTHTLEGMGCTMEELQEAMSRKDYRTMANKIKNMDDRDLAGEMCRTFAEMAKADNPRFKEEMFFAACGMNSPATVLVGEEETMDEGNEFTKARLDAIAQGKDTFSVSGKTYKVSGDTSDEKTQVESIDDEKQEVTEDINLNVTANGEEDVVNLIRKLSGMPMIAIQTPSMAEETMEEQTVEEERDIQWDNTPSETVDPISASIPSGTDLNRSKLQDPETANKAANPLKEKHVEESLWKTYETMINDLKA